LDYLLVGWLAFVNYMSVPYTAAGKNMNFWPIGPVIRRIGAFFLRRSFKGLDLYRAVFASYVKALVADKAFIKFFPEGGRSRTGKLLSPKLGFLGFLLEAVDEGAADDVRFVPTFVGYERVPEEASILAELAGQKKKKESFLAFIRARKMLSRSHGAVHIRFHKALSYQEFRKKRAELTGGSPELASESPELVKDFGYHLMYGIVAASVITPVDLASSSVIASRSSKVTEEQVLEATHIFSTILKAQGAEYAESLHDPERTIKTALARFVLRGMLDVESSDDDAASTVYVVPDQSRTSLEFYRNALMNHLWLATFLSGLLKSRSARPVEIDDNLYNDINGLRKLFRREIIVDSLTSSESILRDTFRLFQDQGWLGAGTAEGVGNGKTPLDYCYGFAADFLELYYAALTALETISGETSVKELGRRMAEVAEKAFPLERTRPAGFPTIAVSNALSGLSDLGPARHDRYRRTVKPGPEFNTIPQWKELLAKVTDARS
jgi:glycerol-3-phosphate O-acyltransferase